MKRLSKNDYITDKTKQMELELKQMIKEDKENAIVQKMIDKMSEERQEVMLKLLSEKFATKTMAHIKFDDGISLSSNPLDSGAKVYKGENK